MDPWGQAGEWRMLSEKMVLRRHRTSYVRHVGPPAVPGMRSGADWRLEWVQEPPRFPCEWKNCHWEQRNDTGVRRAPCSAAPHYTCLMLAMPGRQTAGG